MAFSIFTTLVSVKYRLTHVSLESIRVPLAALSLASRLTTVSLDPVTQATQEVWRPCKTHKRPIPTLKSLGNKVI